MADYIGEGLDASELLRQGVAYAARLHERLQTFGPFVIILGVDQETDDVVVRFHRRRSTESWIAEDLEAYKTDDVLVWESGDPPNSIAPVT